MRKAKAFPTPVIALLVAVMIASLVWIPQAFGQGDVGVTVGLWHLDEPSGTSAPDASGYGNDGTLHNMTDEDWVAGKFGNALDFDGVDDYVEIPDDVSLRPSKLSVEAWVKASESPGWPGYIVGKRYSDSSGSYALYSGGGGLCFYVTITTDYFYLSPNAGLSVWDGAWHHVKGTYDGSYVRLYVDDMEVGSGTPISGDIAYNEGPLCIGSYGRTYLFRGVIDEVKITAYAPRAFNPGVVMNQVCYWPGGDNEEWIELYNRKADRGVNLSGWTFRDSDGNVYTVPGETAIVRGGGYALIHLVDSGMPSDDSDSRGDGVLDLYTGNDTDGTLGAGDLGGDDNAGGDRIYVFDQSTYDTYDYLIDFVGWGDGGGEVFGGSGPDELAERGGLWDTYGPDAPYVVDDSESPSYSYRGRQMYAGAVIGLRVQGKNDEGKADWRLFLGFSDFKASDGEYHQVTLTWTNPPDEGLVEVVVRRKEGSFPSDHTDGEEVYRDMSPTPGEHVSMADIRLLGGVVYYYAVFGRDTDGYWNDAAVEGSNADMGMPAEKVETWQPDGLPICTAEQTQQWSPQSPMAGDGSGGAIIAWDDARDRYTRLIYAQRVDRDGDLKWRLDGVPICTASTDQGGAVIVSDGSGGAIIAWTDGRNRDSTGLDIYAQRVDGDGHVQWSTDGVPICTASANQDFRVMVSDGSGGAIIAWQDSRDTYTTYSDIYAQRVDADGHVQWPADGVPICTASDWQHYPVVVSDGLGGAIIAWQDFRHGKAIYAQRVDSRGAVQWIADGVVVFSPTEQIDILEGPVMVSDGSGGAIIVWSGWGVRAQRVNSSGFIQWAADGVLIAPKRGQPAIAADGSGGAVITWWRGDGYAQRVDADGKALWGADGVVIPATGSWPQIASDGYGGAIITWMDERNKSLGLGTDIYAQWVDANGNVQWIPVGVPICTASDDQNYPVIVSDGSGSAIIAWIDGRGSRRTPGPMWLLQKDIYAYGISYTYAVRAVPDIQLSTTSHDFGGVGIGSHADWTLAVSNVGDTTLTIHSITSDNSIFTIPSPEFPQNISPGESMDITVRCSPIADTTYISTLTLSSNDPDESSLYVSIQGTGVSSGLELKNVVNYPNPFGRGGTRFTYWLSKQATISIEVYTASGELVRDLSGSETSGTVGYNERFWDGKDEDGEVVAPGIYMYRITAEDEGGKSVSQTVKCAKFE